MVKKAEYVSSLLELQSGMLESRSRTGYQVRGVHGSSEQILEPLHLRTPEAEIHSE